MTTIDPERVRQLQALCERVDCCGSNSCQLRKVTGMGTNGPCDCWERMGDGTRGERRMRFAVLAALVRAAPDLLAALAASEARVRELRECLSTLVYLHDKGDRVDESWWQHAREILAASTEPKETTDHE